MAVYRRSAAGNVAAGLCLLAAGGLGLVAVTVPGRARTPGGGWYLSWRYPPDTKIWAVALIVLGVVVAAGWPRRWTPHAAAAAVVGAFMLAGQSGVGIRDWFNVAGAGSISLSSLANVVTIAASCCVVSLAAAASAGMLVFPSLRAGMRHPRRSLMVAAAVAVLAVPALPFLAVGEPLTVTGFGSVLLPWTLPWGAGLLAAAVAHTALTRTLILTVSASAMCTIMLFLVSIQQAR